MKRRIARFLLAFATITTAYGVSVDAAQVKLRSPSPESKTKASADVDSEKAPASAKAASPAESDDASVLIAPNSLRGKTKKPREQDDRAERPVVPAAMRMVLEELAPTKRFGDARVLRAIARTPRADFAPKKLRDLAYRNAETPLEDGKRLEAPLDVAYLLDAVDIQPEDRVLIVDEGAGYVAAVACNLAGEVYAVGTDKKLARRAAVALKALKYGNLGFKEGALDSGWVAYSPYDKIVVAHGVDATPSGLVAQLKDGGKIVAPVGDAYYQTITVGEKRGDAISTTALFPVMLDMFAQNKADVKDDVKRGDWVTGGSFEVVDASPKRDDGNSNDTDSDLSASAPIININRAVAPVGWRGAFNVEVVSGNAYDGAKSCRFDNAIVYAEQRKKERNEARRLAATLPEDRRDKTLEYGDEIRAKQRENELKATLRQNFPLDGGSVRKIVVSGAVKAEQIERDASPNGIDAVRIVFLDKERKELGESTILRLNKETLDWTEFQQDETVPAKTKEATIEVGVLTGVGVVWFDSIQAKSKFER